MTRLPLLAVLLALASPALAQTYSGPPAPQNPQPMPFTRATPNTFMFPFTTTPQQFLVTQPAGSMAYRAFNPCVTAHVRVTSVKALEPIVTEPTIYPGVQRVTTKTEVIDRFSGTRFAPGPETLGSATNPMGGADRIVSGMIVPIRDYPADISGLTCEFEIGYGKGSSLDLDAFRRWFG